MPCRDLLSAEAGLARHGAGPGSYARDAQLPARPSLGPKACPWRAQARDVGNDSACPPALRKRTTSPRRMWKDPDFVFGILLVTSVRRPRGMSRARMSRLERMF